MSESKEILEKVELALIKGDYEFCVEFISPMIKSFPLSTKIGVDLRMRLITALCGINKNEDAIFFCKELLKSQNNEVRENARYLIKILNSAKIKTPENWNIKFEHNLSINNTSLNFKKKLNKSIIEKKKFINTTNIPTGETKPFQKGFIFIISLLLILLIPILS